MESPKLTSNEKKWRAENDAHTLIDAELIKSDSPRSNAALMEVKRMVVETKKKAKTMEKITNNKPVKKSRKK